MRWDVFCRVIDNYGDLGVCRRLAADLAWHGQSVRLWVDDADLARRMVDPQDGATLVDWNEPAPDLEPGDVVVEAFGCDPPERFVRAMAEQTRTGPAPVWINLEYLSAEPFVERSHGLPSPQLCGPGQGLTKWFFYPGFTALTGGLIREEGLMQARASFDRHEWLAQWGAPLRPREEVVSLFAYPSAPLEAMLNDWAEEGRPRWLLVAQGPLQERVQRWMQQWMQQCAAEQEGAHGVRGSADNSLRVTALPWLHHREFDHLLWASDLNLVRGEDSLVRALWAGQPFLWQLYPQKDGAHGPKLEAFLSAFSAAPRDTRVWHAWNRLQPWGPRSWSPPCTAGEVRSWRDSLCAQPSLTRQLMDFASSRSR